MELEEARKIAEDLRYLLGSYCERIEIAGSIRRCKPEVKDIELVAIPKTSTATDLFGVTTGIFSALDNVNWEVIGRVIKAGSRYKQIELKRRQVNLDLFIVLPPAQWGVIYTIRTGPADFSKWIVTPRSKGGRLPFMFHVSDGAVRYRNTKTIAPTPEEIDFLELLELGWIEPWERTPWIKSKSSENKEKNHEQRKTI